MRNQNHQISSGTAGATSAFLNKPTIPLKIGAGKTAKKLLEEMLLTGFQGKSLAECFAIWKEMLAQQDITIWLGIAGAIVPAGMRRVVAYLAERRFVDVIVSTGAQMFHDACECLGVKHFQGSSLADDVALAQAGVDRFYNVYVKEEQQREIDRQIQKFVESLDGDKQYSSREFFELLGKYLAQQTSDHDSIIIQAAKNQVPIYTPALADSSLGYSFLMARKAGQARYVDQIKDLAETAGIAAASKKSGVVYLGGGVPKNFIQQTELLNSIFGQKSTGHEYAIQITTDTPHYGGLSGCTFEEGQSWGKIAKQAKKVQCFCDLTIALPLLVHALAEEENLAAKRRKPQFEFK